jgi:hypothetical protein
VKCGSDDGEKSKVRPLTVPPAFTSIYGAQRGRTDGGAALTAWTVFSAGSSAGSGSAAWGVEGDASAGSC